jgi:DNA-binding CsgD family transcriptional regulator
VTSPAIVVAHREAMVAEAIAAALPQYVGTPSVAAVTTSDQALRRGRAARAVALDRGLTGAAEAAAGLREAGVRVVFLGPGGVPTSRPVAVLAAALDPEVQGRPPLTPRQRQILSLVAQGMAGKQVARRLGISPKTVEQHKTRMFERLGVPNQAAAVGVALTGRLDVGGGSS